FGWVLQVSVDDHRRVTLHVGEAGGSRHLLAEVAAERDRLEALVARVKLLDGGEGRVPGAVVDEQHLPAEPRALEHRPQPIDEGTEAVFLVEHGNDDRQPQALGLGLAPRMDGSWLQRWQWQTLIVLRVLVPRGPA